jgi:DNA-directed RNA polymerase alpha subunit
MYRDAINRVNTVTSALNFLKSPYMSLVFPPEHLKITIKVLSEELKRKREEFNRETWAISGMWNNPVEKVFSTKVQKALLAVNIRILGDVFEMSSSELLQIKGIGEKSLEEINDILNKARKEIEIFP